MKSFDQAIQRKVDLSKQSAMFRLRRRRVANRQCVDCGAPAEQGRTRCAIHMKDIRERRIKSFHKHYRPHPRKISAFSFDRMPPGFYLVEEREPGVFYNLDGTRARGGAWRIIQEGEE